MKKMSDRWFYRVFGQEFGPVSLDLVRTLVSDGTIAPDDEVRNATRSNWILACAASELRDSIKPPVAELPAERRAVRDEWYCRGAAGDFGPLTLSELIQLAAIGELKPDEDVKAWADDYWKQVRSIRRLVELLPFAGPSPTHPARPPLSIFVGEDDLSAQPAVGEPILDRSITGDVAGQSERDSVDEDRERNILLFPGVAGPLPLSSRGATVLESSSIPGLTSVSGVVLHSSAGSQSTVCEESINRPTSPRSMPSKSLSALSTIDSIVNLLELEGFNLVAMRQKVLTPDRYSPLGASLTEASGRSNRRYASTIAQPELGDGQPRTSGSIVDEVVGLESGSTRFAHPSITPFLSNIAIDARLIGISILLAGGLMVVGWMFSH